MTAQAGDAAHTTVPALAGAPAGRSLLPHGPPSLVWLALAVLVLLWLARDVLGPFVVAAVLAYAFSPPVSTAVRRTGLPRAAVVGIGYLVTFAILALLGWFVAGRAASEFALLSSANPDALASTLRQLIGGDTITLAGTTISVAAIAQQVQDAVSGLLSSPGSALGVARQVGDVALNVALVLIVTFYLLVDGRAFIDRTLSLLPPGSQSRTVSLLGRIHVVLGRWLRGEILLVVLVSAVVYVILGPILGLRYALAIGILTGVLEVIPLVGPVVAAAIAAVDAFVQGGAGMAVLVIVVYVVLREVEDQLVMPLVIGRAVHLHPVVTIFAVLVGLSAFGILGGLLGVPAAAAANVVFNELYRGGTTEPTAAQPSD